MPSHLLRTAIPEVKKVTWAELLEADLEATALGHPLLTEAGAAYIRQRHLPTCRNGEAHRDTQIGRRLYLIPSWNGKTGRFWLGDQLLKQFRQPAPNQRALLEAFESQKWAARVADPFGSAQQQPEDGQGRLRETVKSLNATISLQTIRFACDGTGQGARWEFVI